MRTTNKPRYIFRRSIRLKSGRRIYAAHYGKTAFKIRIRNRDEE